MRAWADKVSAWGPAWLAAFAERSNATLLEDKQAIAAAELAFHLFDPSLNLRVEANLTQLSRRSLDPSRTSTPPRRCSPER